MATSPTLLSLADYLAMGVQHIWLIDPLRRGAFRFCGGSKLKT